MEWNRLSISKSPNFYQFCIDQPMLKCSTGAKWDYKWHVIENENFVRLIIEFIHEDNIFWYRFTQYFWSFVH